MGFLRREIIFGRKGLDEMIGKDGILSLLPLALQGEVEHDRRIFLGAALIGNQYFPVRFFRICDVFDGGFWVDLNLDDLRSCHAYLP